MLFISNAISLNMLEHDCALEIKEIKIEEAKKIIEWELSHGRSFTSAVGHESTARVMTAILGIEIPYNRVPVKLQTWDTLLVFQLMSRLPEGAVLDEEAVKELKHKWYKIEVLPEWAGDAVSSVYSRGLF